MSEILNFSCNYYKKIALSKQTIDYQTDKTAKDAFMLCIKDLKYEEVDNLCNEIEKYYKLKEKPILLTPEDCYKLTQGQNTDHISCDAEFKKILLQLAYQCINIGKTIGSKKRGNGQGSTTSWINHCLYQGLASATLAKAQGLDQDTAQKLGILHDIGRKYIHTCMHTIVGFETLIDEGWTEEAFICLTHSFISDQTTNKGGRCCGCDPAILGFYVDDNGLPQWSELTKKDDMTLFLENYTYNIYDSIINMADLMATAHGIVTPYDRVSDIATRTLPDPTNRNYFKAEFSNLMINFLQKSGEIKPNSINQLKATPLVSNEQLDTIFHDISTLFADYYNSISIQKIQSLNNPKQK